MEPIHFDVRFVPAGTGSGIWDDPDATRLIQRFMPREREHGPMIGILHLGAVRPSSKVLRDAIVTIGEDVRAGRYGNFAFVVSSEDDTTRRVVKDIALAQNLAIFVTTSPAYLDEAEPVGDLTPKERETLALVLRAGGTVTATQFGQQLHVQQTTAGNRLIALHKKGYLQRIERPHPLGDQFIDPRSIHLYLS